MREFLLLSGGKPFVEMKMKPLICSLRRALRLLIAGSTALPLLTGCHGNHPHADPDGDHSHEGEPKTAQITVWTDRYEVFAEHHAPVAGKAASFITHVTDLHTLEPRREGMVKFILRQGQAVAEHPQAKPSRAGIYLPKILFPKPGDWNMTLLIPTDGTNAIVELGTVKVYPDEHSALHAAIPDAPEGVSFLKEQQWKILSKAEPVAKRRLVERVPLAARVRPKPGHSATLAAPVSGQLVAPPDVQPPQPGQRVSAGQLLALLRPAFSEAAARVFASEAEFTTAKAALAQAEASYLRTKKLAAAQAKSERELQEAELAWESAKARAAAASGLVAMLRQTDGPASPGTPLLVELRAPIAGVLNSIAAGPGEIVTTGQTIFAVLNTETVWIEARVPESAAGRLGDARGAAVERRDDSQSLVPITGAGRGQLLSLGLEVDAATRTTPLIYETANADGQFRIGQDLTLHAETEHAEDALAIPNSAILDEGEQPVAFVQLSGETFEKRELRLGIRDGDFVQVLDGLREGERVVSKGAYALRLASLSGVIPAHGHAH
jgi:RND family efflux transporter MFP subunit